MSANSNAWYFRKLVEPYKCTSEQHSESWPRYRNTDENLWELSNKIEGGQMQLSMPIEPHHDDDS